MVEGTLKQDDIDRLRKLCGMLGSEHVGERASAALKATELLRAHKLTWADAVMPPTPAWPGNTATPTPRKGRPETTAAPDDWLDVVFRAMDACDSMSDWEYNFMEQMERWKGRPSPKQWAVIDRIARKVGVF